MAFMAQGKITVNLRIEGKTKTIFEGPVLTCGHGVITNTGGYHPCDGTNGGANPCTGPTCTTTLDDGNKIAKYGFDGPYISSKQDFDMTTIGGDKVSGNDFWARCVNFKPNAALGCRIPVNAGDDVLWAYANKITTKYYLKLTGPSIVIPFIPQIFFVTDGATGTPVKGATVNGVSSDAQGRIHLTFQVLGPQRLKAEKNPDSIRSNTFVVNVVETVRGPAKL